MAAALAGLDIFPDRQVIERVRPIAYVAVRSVSETADRTTGIERGRSTAGGSGIPPAQEGSLLVVVLVKLRRKLVPVIDYRGAPVGQVTLRHVEALPGEHLTKF